MSKRLNVKQLCAAAGISRRTAYRWVARGLLPKPEKNGVIILWDVKAVRESLARRQRLLLA